MKKLPICSAKTLAQVCILIIATVFLAGCGKKLNGTYAGGMGAHFDKLTFKSNGKVEMNAAMMGSTEAAYEVDGNNVKLLGAGGQAQVLTMDNQGCLDGGEIIGKYYLVGKDPARIYGTYAGQTEDKLVFTPDGHVTLQMPDNMLFGSYTVAGSQVTVTTEKTFSVPSQTIMLKIISQDTLEDNTGRQMHRQ
jgi:hypothetical protein